MKMTITRTITGLVFGLLLKLNSDDRTAEKYRVERGGQEQYLSPKA